MVFKSDGTVEKDGDGEPSLMMQLLVTRAQHLLSKRSQVINVASGVAGEPVSASSQAALDAALAMSDSSDEMAEEEVTKKEELHEDQGDQEKTTEPHGDSPKTKDYQKKKSKKSKKNKKMGKGMKFGK